jgi:hypothetical protein
LWRVQQQAFVKRKALLWKSLSEPQVPLKVGLMCRDVQRQQAALELLRNLLEDVMNGPDRAAGEPGNAVLG